MLRSDRNLNNVNNETTAPGGDSRPGGTRPPTPYAAAPLSAEPSGGSDGGAGIGGRASPSLSTTTEEYPPRSPPHYSPLFSPSFGEEDGGGEAWGDSEGDLLMFEWETEGDNPLQYPVRFNPNLGNNVSAAVVRKFKSLVMLTIAELAGATHTAALRRLRAAAAEGSQGAAGTSQGTAGASAGTSQGAAGAAAGTSRVSTEATTPEDSTPEAAPRTRARPG